MAARTIPFPTPPGNAATRNVLPSPPPLPPTGAAKLITAPRRYRGLHLVSNDYVCKVSHQLNSLAQTQAIVAQVEREIEQRTTRARMGDQIHLLTPLDPYSTSLTIRATRRVVHSLFPAGL